MADDAVRAGAEGLRQFTREVFTRVGLPPEDADTEAEVLVWANLRGVDSHGVLHIPSYIASVEAGFINLRPDIRVEKETPATILIDADRAFGPVVTTMAMNQVIKRAKDVGVGWGLIRNTTHQGALGYYALMAADKNMAGIASVDGPPIMAPHGARAAGLHNSPIAIAVPGKRHRPLILDMATSVAAGGKVLVAIDKGIPIPEGWSLDDDGSPTTDPRQATVLLPFGGPKGSGLSVMFACLSSLMVGNMPPQHDMLDDQESGHTAQNGFLAAIDIGTFTDVEGYKRHVDDLINGLKSLPKAEGADEIFMPGELEAIVYEDRMRHGIPLPRGTVRNLQAVADRFEIELALSP